METLIADTATATKDRIALRDAVHAYFKAGRANGASHETILRVITGILELSEMQVAARNDSEDGHRELAQELVDWCVEREAGSGKREEGSA